MKKDKLYILWTNADEITSEKMVMMYAINSQLRGWWEEITIIVWGSPNKLIGESKLIREKIEFAQRTGIKISACKSCADELGTTDLLLNLGIEVKYWGEGLTSILKNDEVLITV